MIVDWPLARYLQVCPAGVIRRKNRIYPSFRSLKGVVGRNLLEIRGHSYCRILGREITLQRRGGRQARTAARSDSFGSDKDSLLLLASPAGPPPECSFASS